MNIDTTTSKITKTVSETATVKQHNNATSNFADELSSLSAEKESKDVQEKKTEVTKDVEQEDDIEGVIDGLEDAVAEINEKLSRTDEKDDNSLKKNDKNADKIDIDEDNALINNDMNIQEPNDALTFQMGASMNFNSNGQPFSDFMNNASAKAKLSSSKKDIAEEQAILSTMEENIALANKNKIVTQQSKMKTVVNNEGIQKVDSKSNVIVETVVKFDDVIITEKDVDFFVNLVEQGQVEFNEATAASAKVSKTLADLIAKSMKDNQPIRIDFDNNISVIIKIGKDGKISADFLPSSQIAEAYLKENLPLLKQRFAENNIDYGELNQRQRKQNEKDNQKKGRKDE